MPARVAKKTAPRAPLKKVVRHAASHLPIRTRKDNERIKALLMQPPPAELDRAPARRGVDPVPERSEPDAFDLVCEVSLNGAAVIRGTTRDAYRHALIKEALPRLLEYPVVVLFHSNGQNDATAQMLVQTFKYHGVVYRVMSSSERMIVFSNNIENMGDGRHYITAGSMCTMSSDMTHKEKQCGLHPYKYLLYGGGRVFMHMMQAGIDSIPYENPIGYDVRIDDFDYWRQGTPTRTDDTVRSHPYKVMVRNECKDRIYQTREGFVDKPDAFFDANARGEYEDWQPSPWSVSVWYLGNRLMHFRAARQPRVHDDKDRYSVFVG